MRKTALAILALAMAIPAAAKAPARGPADVAAGVAQAGRPKDRVDLDEVRRPAEVLRFMGLKKGDHVLDYFTGTG